MIKKISALILALVLCLSVMVLPSSALTLADPAAGTGTVWGLEWDKEYYNPGDTAYLSVYIKSNMGDDTQVGGVAFAVGLNSAQIKQADNNKADVLAGMTSNDICQTYYKSPEAGTTTCAWLAASVASAVTDLNTADEQALYDHYFKVVIGVNSIATGGAKYGVAPSDFNVDEPFVVIPFTVASDAAKGTKLVAGITSGGFTHKAVPNYVKYFEVPGTSTAANSLYDISAAKAEATIGEPAPSYGVEWMKDQIRFESAQPDSFDYRTLAKITGFTSFDDMKTKVVEAGYIFNVGSEFDMTKVTTQLNGGEVSYSQLKDAYVSTTYLTTGEYVMSCLVNNVPDTDKDLSLYTLGYIKLSDGTTFITYKDGAHQAPFSTLYDQYNPDNA